MSYEGNGTSLHQYRWQNLAFTNYPVTIGVRFKNNVLGGSSPILASLAWSSSTDQYLRVVFTIGGAIVAASSNGSATNISAPTTNVVADTGNWHTAVGVFEQNQLTSYLDADLVNKGTAVNTNACPSNLNQISFGAMWHTTRQQYFNGSWGEMAIWNAALTDAEVVTYHRSYTPKLIRPESTWEYWPNIRNPAGENGQGIKNKRTLNNPFTSATAPHCTIIQGA